MDDLSRRIEAHYTYAGLEFRILEALRRAGKDPDGLAWEDLSPLDEFHVGGRRATAELARLAGIDKSMHVLDIGCGVGGPARYLAGEHGCRVMGVDITPAFCRAATMLSERTGLSEKVVFRHGDAIDLPCESASFDLVWMQHMSMNIQNKVQLFCEIRRVLKQGCKLACHEVVSGDGGDLYYPVPWAREKQVSFLMSSHQFKQLLESDGFEMLIWEDVTTEARRWFERVVDRLQKHGQPELGLHLLLGPEMTVMSSNMLKNIVEGRIRLVRTVAAAPKTPPPARR
ncbi:MAG: class I SAM-dependent methyltransferase [Candidatus Latescibacterota bacterium]|nr:MAG: class I SAM-dependent methyltransferase [Candidatus Latescibacterota bacterium]